VSFRNTLHSSKYQSSLVEILGTVWFTSEPVMV